MSRTEINLDNRVVAALHWVGGTWRAVVGSRTNGSYRLLDAREFRQGQEEHLQTWLDQHQVGRVICVLPAARVICRSTQLPEADEAQLDAALALQAETYLPGAAPAHRMARAVLPAAQGEAVRSGLIVAWPARAGGPVPPVDRPVSYAPDVAGLAALLGGERTSDVAMWIDRTDGSIALAMPNAQGVSLRAARESSDLTDAWKAGVKQLLTESAFSAGHSEEYIGDLIARIESHLDGLPPGGSELLLPPSALRSARARLERSSEDPAWWSKFGIAAGALLLTASNLEPLAGLLRDEPIEQPGRFDRLISILGTRRAAAMWVIAAAATLMLGPLAFSGVRLFTLHQKVGALEEFKEQKAKRDARLRLYDALVQNTWPMQKLLADITNCAPAGLIFTSINLNESNEKFEVQGTADSQELVIDMLARLRETGIFQDVFHNYTQRDGMKATFSITASVSAPYRLAKYEDDYSETSLAMRLYPDEFRRIREYEERRSGGASGVPTGGTSRAPSDAASGSGDVTGEQAPQLPNRDLADRPSVRTESTASGGNGETALDDQTATAAFENGSSVTEIGRTGPRSVNPRANIPALAQGDGGEQRGPTLPPIRTAEEIRALDRAALIDAMLKVREAMRLPSISEEDRTNLGDQFNLMRQYLNELPR